MSNKKNKEIEVHDSDSEEEQPSGDEKDPDFDSDGNYIGDKEVNQIHNPKITWHAASGLEFLFIFIANISCLTITSLFYSIVFHLFDVNTRFKALSQWFHLFLFTKYYEIECNAIW